MDGVPWNIYFSQNRVIERNHITIYKGLGIVLNLAGMKHRGKHKLFLLKNFHPLISCFPGKNLIKKLDRSISANGSAGKLIKWDPKLKANPIEPIIFPKDRHHIKNKTLFPLMQQREVLFFTLLEGEIVRGVLLAFSRYDLTIGLKGGIPVVVMRHGVRDVRDKQGRCYLKSHIEPKTA